MGNSFPLLQAISALSQVVEDQLITVTGRKNYMTVFKNCKKKYIYIKIKQKPLELSDIYRLTLKRGDFLIHAIETKSEK